MLLIMQAIHECWLRTKEATFEVKGMIERQARKGTNIAQETIGEAPYL